MTYPPSFAKYQSSFGKLVDTSPASLQKLWDALNPAQQKFYIGAKPKTGGISEGTYARPEPKTGGTPTKVAPAGYEYNAQGNLVPKDNSSPIINVSKTSPGVMTSTPYTPPSVPNIGLATEAFTAPQPGLPDMTSIIKNSNIPSLQQSLTDIQAQKLDLQNRFNAYKLSLAGTGVAAGIVDVQTNAEAKAMQIQLDSLNTEESIASQNLSNAQQYVAMLMQAGQQDYQNAATQYQNNFSNAMAIQKLFNTTVTDAINRASAYLGTVANLISTTGINWATISPTMKSTIELMEAQAGWPTGTLESFARAKPGANILTMVNGVDANDQNTITFFYSNPDGTPGMMQTFGTGTYKETPLQTAVRQMSLMRGQQMLESSKALEANRIIGPQARSDPTLKLYSTALGLKPKFDAASQDIQTNGPTDPNTKELLDVATQIMTGGNQITEGQIALNTQYQSYYSQLQTWLNKFNDKGGGAISGVAANQIIDLVNKTYNLYQDSYGQRIQVYNDRLKNVAGQDLSNYSPLTDIRNLPSVLDGSLEQAQTQQQTTLGGLGTIDLSTLSSDQLQQLIDAGLVTQ